MFLPLNPVITIIVFLREYFHLFVLFSSVSFTLQIDQFYKTMPSKPPTPKKSPNLVNQFSVLPLDDLSPRQSPNLSSSSEDSLVSINPKDSLEKQLISFQLVLKLPKNLLQEQWNFMSDSFKKVLTQQLSHIGQVKKENLEYYHGLLRMIKYLAMGEKVAAKLGNDTDVIPLILYLAFDANTVNDKFIDEEIVRLGKFLLFLIHVY